MAISEKRKKILLDQKRRAMMKDIARREAAQEERPLMPYRGVDALRALREADRGNIKGDFKAAMENPDENLEEDLDARLASSDLGEERDLRNIEKYGDRAMRSRAFGSRQTKAKGGTVSAKRFMNGGAVMSGRGVRDTKMS